MRLDHKYKQRRSIRLKGYDYSSSGWYFVTLCTKDRDCYFGEYPELMNIVLDEWNSIPNNFNNVELDEYIIMPNHIHGIIHIVGVPLAGTRVSRTRSPNTHSPQAGARPGDDIIVGASLAVARVSCTRSPNTHSPQAGARPGDDIVLRAGARPAPTLGDIIGTFKSRSVNRWLRHIKKHNLNILGKFWQRNYHDHIIRNDKELYAIRRYIKDNPPNWLNDKDHPRFRE